MAEPCPAEFVRFAETLADAARAAIMPHFRTRFQVDAKADLSPVTIADRNAERAMRERIEATYKHHGIYGEEFGTVRADAEFVWILDPIDGTKSFITGLPLFGTLIALTQGGRAILGVIDQPVLAERWVGAAGRPTQLNGQDTRTRACTALGQAALFTTSSDLWDTVEAAAFDRLRRQVRVTRLAGDCYAYALVASGFADLVVESTVQPYDFAALAPVLEGAGGRITDWEGRPLAMDRKSRVLAAGDAAAHRAAMAVLAG